MGGKGGGGGSSAVMGEPTTVEGAKYWEDNPDVAASGMNPYYHYQTFGQKEGRAWGEQAAPQEESGGGFSFEMPSFEMPPMPDYAAMQAQNQADAEARLARQNIDVMYSNKFAAANAAIDRVDTQLAEEMGYAKVGGADYSYTPEQRKERINNMFATLWSEQDDSKLSSLENSYGPGNNKWNIDVVRGTPKDKGALTKGEEGAKAGKAVDPTRVLSKLLGSSIDDEKDSLGGILGKLGGA
jgi:hypothetical protein